MCPLKIRLSLFLLALTLPLLPHPAFCALGDHLWSQGINNSSQTDVDGLGNVASSGTFYGSMSFGGPTLIAAGTGPNVFLIKHDTSGSHVWSQSFAPTDGFVIVSYLACDENGNIFIAGSLLGDPEFPGAGPGVIDFGGGPIFGDNEIFLAGFDSAGAHRFSFVVGTGNSRDLAAQGGTVALTGYTSGSLDFGGGALTSAGSSDVFVGSVTIDGAHQWSAVYGDTGSQGGMAVDVDGAGNVVLVATTLSTIDFGGGALSPTGTGLCLVKFTVSGSHSWSQMFDGTFTNGAGILTNCDVAVSRDGAKIALAGHMNDSCSFGGGTLTSNGSGDMYLAQYNASGNHEWSMNYGGTNTDEARGVEYDSNGNVFVAGTFASANCTFGGGSFTPVSFGADFFVALYDPSGAHLWSDSYGFSSQSRIHAHTDSQNNLVITGSASSGIDFGGGPPAGANTFHAEFEGNGPGTPTAVGPILRTATLLPNVPNPFNPVTTIHFELDLAGPTELTIYDATGRKVKTLVRGDMPVGAHSITWSGTDSSGGSVASGTYFYRLTYAGKAQTRKMTLAK